MTRTDKVDKRMSPSRLAEHPTRRQILKIISGKPFDSARRLDDIWYDISVSSSISYSSFFRHIKTLVKYGVVYEQYDYVREKGKIYSIYWSDTADQVMQIVEGKSS